MAPVLQMTLCTLVKRHVNCLPPNEVAEVNKPCKPSTLLSCHQHEEVRQEGRDKCMEYPIAKGVIYQEHPCRDSIQMATCKHDTLCIDLLSLCYLVNLTSCA